MNFSKIITTLSILGLLLGSLNACSPKIGPAHGTSTGNPEIGIPELGSNNTSVNPPVLSDPKGGLPEGTGQPHPTFASNENIQKFAGQELHMIIGDDYDTPQVITGRPLDFNNPASEYVTFSNSLGEALVLKRLVDGIRVQIVALYVADEKSNPVPRVYTLDTGDNDSLLMIEDPREVPNFEKFLNNTEPAMTNIYTVDQLEKSFLAFISVNGFKDSSAKDWAESLTSSGSLKNLVETH